MTVFGRPRQDLDKRRRVHADMADAFEDILQNTRSLNTRSTGWNMMHDQRVNEDWADQWFMNYGRPVTSDGLKDALQDYGQDFREPGKWLDVYADLETKGRNFISKLAEPSGQLVHILDLFSRNSRRIWTFGKQQGIGQLGVQLSSWDEVLGPLPSSIIDILDSGDVNRQIPLMRDFLNSWNQYLRLVITRRKEGPSNLNLIWVTLWEQWRMIGGNSGNDWCDSVGLTKNGRTWVAVLRYSTNRLTGSLRLVRPTQLEAGHFGRHFPTPPDCGMCEGGRVVEGRNSIILPRTLPEYLHGPIEFSLDDWLGSGCAVQTVTAVGAESALLTDRERHWTGLGREFPATGAWMERANA